MIQITEDLREEVEGRRKADYEISPLFLNRYSPRALEREMAEEDLKAMFEAARWAPSSYNNQSWRFVYSTHEDEEWDMFVDFMNDFNASWASEGYALVVLISKTTFDHNGEHSRTHSFDTGAAWENFALEASRRGLVAHGMQGIDYEKIEEELEVPEEYEVEMMIAVGSHGDESELDEDVQVKPNNRKDMDEIVSKGAFNFQA